MPKIIVSYRRSDTQAIAGRIYDRLSAYYGDESVFMDIDKIPVGTDFRQYIRNELGQADLLLAIIGPHWLESREDGRKRISERADPVRIEIETALEGGIPVVPVLVDGASMPGEDQLPDTFKDFAFINAAVVDIGRDFRQHMDRLIRAIDGILTRPKLSKDEVRQVPAGGEEFSTGEAAPPVQHEPSASSTPSAQERAAPSPAPVEQASERRPLHPAALGLVAALAIGIGAGAYYLSSDDRTASPRLISTPPGATAQAPVNPAGSDISATTPTGQPPAPPNTEVQSPAKINTANLSSVAWRLQSTLEGSTQSTLSLLTKRVNELSDGRMRVETFPAGAIVRSYEVLDAVNKGVVEMGYATGVTSYGKHRAFVLMTAVPFGFAPREHLAFRRRPDVREAFDQILSDLKLNVVALPCGDLGRIGELWLKRPLKQESDLAGKKLRVLGLAADIYKTLGSTPVALTFGEVYSAMQTGVIDGGQYSTPKNDLDAKFAEVMKTYYHPSSIQPAYALDLYVNKTKWNALPSDGRAVIEIACREAADQMLTEQERIDRDGLAELSKRGVTVAPLPKAIESALRAAGDSVLYEQRRNFDFDRIMRIAEDLRSSQQPVSRR